MEQKNVKQKLEYITAVFIYGTIGPLIRFVSLPSEVIVLCRGVIGTAFIGLFLWIRKYKYNKQAIKENLFPLVASGICLGFNWICLFAAYNITSVAIASLCNYTAPIIMVILAPFLYGEKLTPLKKICIVTSFIGIVLISGVFPNGFEGMNLPGLVLGFLSAAGFVGLVIFNKKLKNVTQYDKLMVQLPSSVLIVLPYVIFHNIGKTMTFDTKSIIIVLILGIVHTGIAYSFYFDSLSAIPVQAVAVLGYIEPVVTIILSALVLHESLDLFGIIGAVLILGSAVLSELKS